MAAVCPISSQQVNAKTAQFNAALTVLCVMVFLLTPVRAVAVVLLVDFFIRGFLKPGYSLFNQMSQVVLKRLKVQPVMTNAGPKIFAARIGFLVVSLMTLAWLLNYFLIATALGAILALFAALEAAFNFCVACKAYPLLRRITGSAA